MPKPQTAPAPAVSEELPALESDAAKPWNSISLSDLPDDHEVVLAVKRTLVPVETETAKPVRIFSYNGWPSNNMGADGDFFIDELANMLYGPKANGVWPEEGTPAIGVCKRNAFGTYAPPLRSTAVPKGNMFTRAIMALWRFVRSA